MERSRIKKLLKENIQALDSFAHTVAHDLRSPLATIIGFNDIILRKSQDTEIKEYIEKVHGTAIRMSKLIESLLNYSKIDHQELPKEEIDLNSMINEICKDTDIKEENITYNNLPIIYGVKSMAYQLFLNLIANALKYSKEGLPPLIKLSSEESDKDIKIYIEDNGIGIEENRLKECFEPFKRVTNEKSGFGIGLATCRRICDRHGWSIKALKHTPGALFVITIKKNVA